MERQPTCEYCANDIDKSDFNILASHNEYKDREDTFIVDRMCMTHMKDSKVLYQSGSLVLVEWEPKEE